MVQFVLILGVLNLLLGYGLAALLAEPPLSGFAPWKKWSLSWPRIRPGTAAVPSVETDVIDAPTLESAPAEREEEEEVAPVEVAAPQLPPVATLDELPLTWRELLEAERISPRWLADGVVHAMRIQLAVYRQQVLAAESRARLVLSQENSEGVEQLVADFRFLHHEWLGRVLEGAHLLRTRHGRLGDAEECAGRLEALLYDRASQMEALDRRISEINFKTDVVLGCRRLLAELLDLTAVIHVLRDDLTAGLAAIARQQQTLEDLSGDQRLDALTGRLNRIGLEVVASESGGHEGCHRQAILIALDDFRRINERLGTRVGDRLLRTFSQLLADLIESARASAEIVRLAGTRFLLLVDGISRDQATSLAEQLRQSLEGVTFDSQGTCFGMSARIGISEMKDGELLEPLLQRLESAVEAAETAGRNRCAVADADGAKVVPPQAVAVVGRRVTVGDASDIAVQTPLATSVRDSQPPAPQPELAVEPGTSEPSTSS